MAVNADSVIVDLIANNKAYDAAVASSAAKFEKAMDDTSKSADAAAAKADKAAQKKAEAEERAAVRVAEAAEKSRIRIEEAAQKAALAAEASAAKTAAAGDIAAQRAIASAQKAAQRKAEAEASGSAKAQAASERAAAQAERDAARSIAASERAANQKAQAAEKAALREASAAENARKREETAAKRAADNFAKQKAREASAADIAATRESQSAQKALNRTGAATRNLGRQVSDIGVGLASGQSPFLILAQQAPQVADALADTGGKAARVAAFFAGPWGAALLAAGSIAGVLAGKLLETGDAAATATPKVERYTDVLARLAGIDLGDLKIINRIGAIRDEVDGIGGLIAKNQELGTAGTRAATQQIAANKKKIATLQAERAGLEGTLALNKRADRLSDEKDKRDEAARDAKSKADQAARKAEADAIAHAKELQSVLIQMEKAYDPIAASARSYADVLRDINSLEAGGRLSPAKAETYRNAAEIGRRLEIEAKEATARAKQTSDIGTVLDRPGGISDTVARSDAGIDRRAEMRFQAENEVNLRLQREQQSRIQSLASLYEQAFTGGTGSIWKAFEREGIRVIALLLAKFTILQATQGSGGFGNILKNLGSAAGSAIKMSSLFGGLASGGYAAPHSIHRVNEGSGNVELLRMGAQGGQVVPLGRVNAARGGGGGGVTIAPNITIDARNNADPAYIQQVARAATMQGLAEAAPIFIAGAQAQTIQTISRARLPVGAG